MSFAHRAVLYIVRRRTNTLILFFIMLVISTLALTGLAIRSATGQAELNVRQALGGVFTVGQNTNDPSKWRDEQVSHQFGSGVKSYYTGDPLTTELADYIMGNTSGIIGYNGSYVAHQVAQRPDGGDLTLVKSEEESRIDSILAGMGDLGKTVPIYSSTNTRYDSYFSAGYLQLTEGRHIVVDDDAVGLISRELAELNGLGVGDRLAIRKTDNSSFLTEPAPRPDSGATTVDLGQTIEIIGLFDSTTKSTTQLSNWSMDNSVFTTLDVIDRVLPDRGEEGYTSLTFQVDDPAKLDQILSTVQGLPDIDPTDFVITADTSEADAVMSPLANMATLVTWLIVGILAVGAVVLYLVLANRVKDRIRESGILLSLGATKAAVIGQYCLEVVLVTIPTLVVAALSSRAIAQVAGDQLLDYSLRQAAADTSTAQEPAPGGVVIVDTSTYAPAFEGTGNLTEIQVVIDSQSIMWVSVIALIIIVGAVVLAGIPFLRLQPRQLLTTMS